MSTETQKIEEKSVHKHIPRHALVVGSSGIVGHNLTKYLLLNHDWKVTGIAKKEYIHCPKGLDVLYCDLLNIENFKQCLTEEKLKGITHIFYAAWVKGSTLEEESEINRKMFENVLSLAKNAPCLKYVYLQTGTKYYGLFDSEFKGRLPSPHKENEKKLDIPNFYYGQEDALINFCKEKNIRYNISRPPTIIGFTLDNMMNFGVSLAVYACILKELGEPLIFPGSEKAFNCLREFVDVGLLCRFILFLQSHHHATGEVFNITNGDMIRPSQFWPQIAEYFGMEWRIADKGFSITEFMKDKEQVWRKVIQKYGLHDIPLKSVETFDFLENVLCREWDEGSNINKVEKFGFRCHNDTDTLMLRFFDSLKNLKIIPEEEPVA